MEKRYSSSIDRAAWVAAVARVHDALFAGRPVMAEVGEYNSVPAGTIVPVVLAGLGTSILTTSRGVMTGQAAVKAGVGGEVLCNVW